MADPAGYTPLSNAVDWGNVETTQYLLDKGANPNVRIIDSSMLISAVLRNRKEMVELLLQRGADVSAKGKNHGSEKPEQKTALGWARTKHLDDMVRLLIKAGAKD